MTRAEVQVLLDSSSDVKLTEPISLSDGIPLYVHGPNNRITFSGRGDGSAISGSGPGLCVLPRQMRFNSDGTYRDLSIHFVSGENNRYGFRTFGKAVLTYPGSQVSLGPTNRGIVSTYGKLGYGVVSRLQIDIWVENNESLGWGGPWVTFCGAMGNQNDPSPFTIGSNNNEIWLLVRLSNGQTKKFTWYNDNLSKRERVLSFRIDVSLGSVGLSIDAGPYVSQTIPGWSSGITLWSDYGGPFQIGGVDYSGGQRFAPPDWTLWGLYLHTEFTDILDWYALPANSGRLFQFNPQPPEVLGSLNTFYYGPSGWGKGFVQVVDPSLNDSAAVQCTIRDIVYRGNGDNPTNACCLVATCRGDEGIQIRDCRFESGAFGVLHLPLFGRSYPIRIDHVVCKYNWAAGVDLTGTGWTSLNDVKVFYPARHAFRGIDGGGEIAGLRVAGGGGNGVQPVQDVVKLNNYNTSISQSSFDFEDGSAPPGRSYINVEGCQYLIIEDSDGAEPAREAEIVCSDVEYLEVVRSLDSTPGRVKPIDPTGYIPRRGRLQWYGKRP